MTDHERRQAKEASLREQGAWNPRAHLVTDPLFAENGFFDPRDMVQVKYEMLRRNGVGGEPVSRVTAAFGLSRPSFYQAKDALARSGLPGLVARKRGPQGGYKVTAEVLAFIRESMKADASLTPAVLARRVRERFGVEVHPRSVARALGRQEKKQP
jgi:transposase